MTDFYDRDGRPLDLVSWAQLFEDDAYRRLRATDLGTYWVSTIWTGFDPGLGIDHGAPPRIYEMAIFAKTADEDPLRCDGRKYQYASEELALGAHDWTCTQLMRGLDA